ncbi:MAG: hemerythrin domain-containing protein [Flavobacteriaceae bacterium]|nr:hemerythrin domain-containing protein [Flavobacteriaceae bacterium]
MSIDLKNLNKQDPIKRMVERQNKTEEFSPMDPPDAFQPPALDEVKYEDMHPIIQLLIDEHKDCNDAISTFENTLNSLHTNGFSKNTLEEINDFFSFFDDFVIEHNRKEDNTIFADLNIILHQKEEFSIGTKKTVVDLMEDDHIKMLQLAAISFNLFGLVTRIPDQNSGMVILDLAIEQSKALIEILKLHIFREDNVVFPMANNYLSTKALDAMKVKLV